MVNVSKAVLVSLSTTDTDSTGCPLVPGSNSVKLYLETTITVTNLGGSDFIPAASTVQAINCGKTPAVMDFFTLTFPGGPYKKHLKCVADGQHSCTLDGQGISAGGSYSGVVYFTVNAAAVHAYSAATYPTMVLIPSSIAAGAAGTISTLMIIH